MQEKEKITNTVSADMPTLTADAVEDMLEGRRYAELKAQTEHLFAPDIADIMEELPAAYQTRFFRLLGK